MHSVMEGTSGGQEKGATAAAGNGRVENLEAKVVEWEEFQDVWGQMCGRGLVLKKALVDREALYQQVEAGLKVFLVFFECVWMLVRSFGTHVSSISGNLVKQDYYVIL